MENIFNPKTRENIGYGIKEKPDGISANKILYATAGSLLLGLTLKIAGKRKTASSIGKWALPLLALGGYKKFSGSNASKTEENAENDLKGNS
ncbi:hypothetical protein NJT12_11515 [Flavobacterium sp. AC]|uniref:DUF2892 domain-containing protein n=1 Tax=Flavobacterium azizsancarii TaxID=2961580 RepID=A0ABT4WCH8_9FLAO|nr:hypothetical protein [Flavobacterium azizsancarii]MDA6070246.1 hypothetical protein [Flavobacterium azizsancarii]